MDVEFDQVFNFASFFIPLIFVIVICIILFQVISGLTTWIKNNNAPNVTTLATIVAKRTDVSYHHSDNGSTHHSTYYVTFQDANGKRQEFSISRREYGLLAEQDQGTLNYQGTRFLNFERNA